MINNLKNIGIYGNYGLNTPSKQNVKFCGNPVTETIKHYNIGMMAHGYIGKIRVRTAENAEAFLNIFKQKDYGNREIYYVKNEADKVIGEMKIDIRKYTDYNRFTNPVDPSHVWVNELRNFSKAGTPYHNKELPYYKDIGTRLLQIAQRRSDECQCAGNIKLIAKAEAMDWYKKLGFVQEFPPMPNSKLRFCVNNPNQMYLPPFAKEPLSRIQGGL